MTQARSTIVSTADTPYYHCVSRCVRRAYLCGYDRTSKTDFEHRRQWLEDKLHQTAEAFAIKLCAYAVMSNHYHVVLHLRPDIASKLNKMEVVRRWHSLFKGTYLSQCYEAGTPLLAAQLKVVEKDIEIWRERLSSLSWFMKVVNESIARRANLEDKCTGHFSVTAPALLYLLHPCSRGKVASKAKRYWMSVRCLPAWRMLTSTLFAPTWQTHRKNQTTPALSLELKVLSQTPSQSGQLKTSSAPLQIPKASLLFCATTLSWLIGQGELFEKAKLAP
jgi:REP element-mobilizing transposase RayT